MVQFQSNTKSITIGKIKKYKGSKKLEKYRGTRNKGQFAHGRTIMQKDEEKGEKGRNNREAAAEENDRS